MNPAVSIAFYEGVSRIASLGEGATDGDVRILQEAVEAIKLSREGKQDGTEEPIDEINEEREIQQQEEEDNRRSVRTENSNDPLDVVVDYYENSQHTCYCRFPKSKTFGKYRTHTWALHKKRPVHLNQLNPDKDALIDGIIEAFNPKKKNARK